MDQVGRAVASITDRLAGRDDPVRVIVGCVSMIILAARHPDEPLPVDSDPAEDAGSGTLRRSMTPRAGCWHCGEPLPANVVILRAHRGPVAPDVLSRLSRGRRVDRTTRPRRLLSFAHAAGAEAATGPAATIAVATPGNAPEIARHVIRDLGAGCRETMLLIEGVRCVGLRVADRTRAWRAARRGQRPGQCSSSARASHVARRDDYVAADPATRLALTGYRAHAADAAHSTMCVDASRATRSSGCSSPDSAPCRR